MPKKVTAKKPAAKKSPPKKPAAPADFAKAFKALKAILTPYAKTMVVVKNDAEWYYLDLKQIGPNKKPVFFAAVRVGKAYVSFHLMPVYCNPKLAAAMSPELKKRMQGKACFNFKEPDPTLFAELAELTKSGAEWFATIDWANFKYPRTNRVAIGEASWRAAGFSPAVFFHLQAPRG
jgi:hypothetical protein